MTWRATVLVLALGVGGCAEGYPNEAWWEGTFRADDPVLAAYGTLAADEWCRASEGRVCFEVEQVTSELTTWSAWSITRHEIEGKVGGADGCSIAIRPEVSGEYVRDVLIHEMGHVAGLAHTDVPGATMWHRVTAHQVDELAVTALEDVRPWDPADCPNVP